MKEVEKEGQFSVQFPSTIGPIYLLFRHRPSAKPNLPRFTGAADRHSLAGRVIVGVGESGMYAHLHTVL